MNRYLFGPVNAHFAEQKLGRQRREGRCLAFNSTGDVGLQISCADDWQTISSRFPEGWEPDAIILWLPYSTIPHSLWSAPVPVLALAGDWNLLWHSYRPRLRQCELVLTDAQGVEVMRREGIEHAWAANLYGGERQCADNPVVSQDRDIDVLFVGNLNADVQRERMPWLRRIALLSKRWRVLITDGIYGAEYYRLLARAKIVVNRGIRQECNQRVIETVASGALLFEEEGNLEVPGLLADRRECVYYGRSNFESLVEHYLAHEDERQAIAHRAQQRSGEFTFETLWQGHLDLIGQEWPQLLQRQARRPQLTEQELLLARTWQAIATSQHEDVTLFGALKQHASGGTTSNALGVLVAWLNARSNLTPQQLARAAGESFQRACELERSHAVARFNLAESMVIAGQRAEALKHLRDLLVLVDDASELPAQVLQSPHFPVQFDAFRVEWERAAWQHAGDSLAESNAKRRLLRWRCHFLLGQLTGELAHYYEAHRARPDLPTSQAALGQALQRSGQHLEAIDYLRQAVASNPFDRASARSLFQVLGEVGRAPEQHQLAMEQAVLARAAPKHVPVEPWFGELPPRLDSTSTKRFNIVWEGPQLALHSFTVVNRELCLGLIERGHQVSLLSAAPPQGEVPTIDPRLMERLNRPSGEPAQVHVRHRWPPDFKPPTSGHWVVIQPWEFGSLPRQWIEQLRAAVDEVWVPSNYVRWCYLRSGMPADRVHVVPNGVDTKKFHPEVTRFPLRTNKKFRFLFVGGTIHRKGIDLLLGSYVDTFKASDDVCLVIKDLGAGTFYQGQTAEQFIGQIRARPGTPEIEYIDRKLSDEELAGLYTACGCLVHPYRGEGFGLPIAEAMACGLPVIVTGYGAALDFCNEENAHLLPAKARLFAQARVGELDTVDLPWLAEPDLQALKRQMQHTFEHTEEAKRKGQLACADIRREFTWERSAQIVECRIGELLQRPIRRRALAAPGRIATSSVPDPASLVSIVVSLRGNAEANRQCLANILQHSRRPFELILVDAGRDEATSRLVEEVRRDNAIRVEVIAAGESRLSSLNQASKAARGEFIAFIDGDIVVTENWLGNLVKCLIHDWPTAGMVGPVTNSADTIQKIETSYESLDELPAFARQRREDFRGRAVEVDRLSSSCLLVGREVLEKIGGFDERFAENLHADADLSMRVKLERCKLRVALDVFVHRSALSEAEQLDLRKQDEGRYVAKWSTKPATSFQRLPEKPWIQSANTTGPRTQKVSLCMIVKNEERVLATCLRSVADLVDEMIVVDTGSTDRTRVIAEECGARVFDFVWIDDFSAARNESLRHASHPWIFWLDADEQLDEGNRERLRSLLAGLNDEKAAYVMKQFSVSPDDPASAVAVDQVRLFRNDPGVRWEYRIHEQILLSIRRVVHDVRWTDIIIAHSGYQDTGSSQSKLDRNVRLLELQMREQPDDPVAMYHLGLAYQQMGRGAEAMNLLQHCLDATPADYSIRPKIYSVMAREQCGLRQLDTALATCELGRQQYPNDIELLFLEGLLLHETNRLSQAAERFLKLLSLPPMQHFASTDAGLRTYKARHQLAMIYKKQGKLSQAESELKTALKQQPNFELARRELARLYSGSETH